MELRLDCDCGKKKRNLENICMKNELDMMMEEKSQSLLLLPTKRVLRIFALQRLNKRFTHVWNKYKQKYVLDTAVHREYSAGQAKMQTTLPGNLQSREAPMGTIFIEENRILKQDLDPVVPEEKLRLEDERAGHGVFGAPSKR
ncbi:hypothetical protein E2I00_013276 [Balaenoptera physalus]|uniref:Uncharacterized protein n=1 Tax=Balaenoptera physalus TaxID=9770 RepID=A0A6A1QE41_BALPH|nr:hypothetical protein E2I00_013276 [Balaenoptera physalus]